MIDRIEYDNFLEFVVEQGTEEWWELKKGIPSASQYHRILTPARGEISKQAEDYAAELIGDEFGLIAPEGVENFTNRAVRWGIETENEAREWYCFQTGLEVRRAGWLTTKDGRFGCSPDGLVGETGGLELKCPQSKTHVLYCLDPRRLLMDYRCQVHGALWISKRQWWDLVSYCPGLPGLRMRIEPDEFTDKLGIALGHFWTMLQDMRTKIVGQPEIELTAPATAD